MMKKFSKILLCLILCVITFGLVACGGNKDSFVYPSTAGVAVGNGGMAVTVGDYLYFVNGYISVDDLEDDDRNGSFTVGSIIVAKLDTNGNLILDEDELLDDDYYRTISDKLAGFEATGLYAYGEYLYFTTPCQEKSKGGTWENGLVDFYKIKLDASSKAERIYQSTVENGSLEFAFYNAGGTTYLLVYEQDDDNGNSLYRVNASTGKVVETISDVTSVVMPTDDGVNFVGCDYYNVFYLVDGATVMYRLNVITGEKAQCSLSYVSSDSELNEVLDVIQNKYVFVSVTREQGGSTTYYDLYRYDLSTGKSVRVLSDIEDYTLYFAPDGTAIVDRSTNIIDVVAVVDDQIKYYTITIDEDTDVTISTFIGFANGCIVYYDSNYNIKMASYLNVLNGLDPNIKTLYADADEEINTSYFDLDEYYVYYYKMVGSNLYLHRLAVNNNNNSGEDEMVGVYLTDDIPETDEEEETT